VNQRISVDPHTRTVISSAISAEMRGDRLPLIVTYSVMHSAGGNSVVDDGAQLAAVPRHFACIGNPPGGKL